MRSTSVFLATLVVALSLTACGSDRRGAASSTACADGQDNDADTLADFPADPGCSSADDNNETDPAPPPACSDNLDNDSDGKIDLTDPGCTSATDTDETDPVAPPACSDGADNDSDGKTDLADPGCANAADTDETDPVVLPACSDGVDNDSDGKTDLTDPGCTNVADTDETDAVPAVTRSRYSMNNQCWALRANNGNYVVRNATSYTATATEIANAEPFFMKPSALGKYLFYNRNRQLMSVGTAPALVHVASASATDKSEWTVVGVGDATNYPPTPDYDREPTPAEVTTYQGFVDPNLMSSAFTIASPVSNTRLAVDGGGNLGAIAPGSSPPNESFSFEPLTADKCSSFPEAQSNVVGETFKGKTADGRVLGMADVHVHISSSTFLGKAQWGSPFHKFGVSHAIGACDEAHGSEGERDIVGGFLTGGGDPRHDTRGWPDFAEWPAAAALTHQAIYWKWLERAWKAGLRIAVNDLVENGTLCELQRNNTQDPTLDCNEMNSAGRQAGTMYAMQDYIDGQYGGRGEGFFQIVYTPDEARTVIEKGQLAVVLGIEVSNFLNCQITYNPSPLRKEPFEEPAAGPPGENSYACKMTETGADDEILTQLKRIKDLGVRQVISIHEFDNAFGGNGIFFPLINVGNRENSGGIPVGTVSGGFETDPETPTGEFWTTYDCPVENVTPGFSGYLWENRGGASGEDLRRTGTPEECNPGNPDQCTPPPPAPPLCQFTGQGGRPGGTSLCYPDTQQCNARWMTPIGVYMYSKLMEQGFIFDFDHMELEMKTQALELAEAQPVAYPFVSTHGTFGGTSNDHAMRVLRNGGFLYPSLGRSSQMRTEMDETLSVYNTAMVSVTPTERHLFSFGFGTDTNGLSDQAGTEADVTYPFTLFDGSVFDNLSDFANIGGVVFEKPNSLREDGSEARTWNIALDGSAHYGMLSDMVQGLRLHGTPDQMRHMFNSAEGFLRTWERTLQSSTSIKGNPGGKAIVPATILRQAPDAETECVFTPSGACGR